MPLLSIITVNYNNKSGLEKTIASVTSQELKNFEFIVIDGGSEDGSREVIEKFRPVFTKAVSERDNGIYEAMNKGIKMATGEYLLFLNSGDWFYNDRVTSEVEPYLDGTDVISGDINIFENGRWSIFRSEDQITIDYFLRISLYHQATFVKRDLFTSHGFYDESFRLGGDYEFFIRTLLKENNRYKHIPLTVSNFIAEGISNRKEYEALNMKERKMAWENNFSPLVYQHFLNSKTIKYSREIKWGRRFFRFFPFASAIDRLITKIWY